MATLLLRMTGPMQSWGCCSRFDERDTSKEPTKSGVVGLLAAAMGIDRSSWDALKPLTELSMAVRHDRPGVLMKDYQTAGCASSDTISKADGANSKDGIVSKRYYLADAAFLVALEGESSLLETLQSALKNPVWALSLGRKSYLPSDEIWVQDGLQEGSLVEVISQWPWICSLRHNERYPDHLLLSRDSENGEGVFRMDQPISNFTLRKFGARIVKSEWIPFPMEASNVSL
jgi:CRISPR system Cascade subunit CasD